MIIETTRFGTIETNDGAVLRFPNGLHGFPEEREMVLLRPRADAKGAWLQSIKTPWMALPVVTLEAIATEYPNADAARQIEASSSDPTSLALLLVLHAPPWPRTATVNLVAPILVNVLARTGEQILLRGTSYSAREPFALREFMGARTDAQSGRSTATEDVAA